MSSPKISLITISFNAEKSIKKTLDSIHSQQGVEFEYIVIDGASTDNTLEVIKQHPIQVDKLVSEPDKGIYDGINKGIKLATGDVIGLLHADDFFTDDKVLSTISEIFQNKNSDILYGDLQYVEVAHRRDKIKRHWKAGKFKKDSFLYGWMPPHPTLYVRKSLIEKVGFYRTDLKIAGDYEFMLRLMHLNPDLNITYLPKVLVKMAVGGASNASLKNRIVANTEDELAWKLNGVTPKWYTRYLKPLRKIPQFLRT